MANDPLYALYRRQQVVLDRNSSAILRWGAYISALPIPATKPDEAWVQARLVSDRVAENIDGYTQRTLSYFLQDPSVTQGDAIHDWLNAFNRPTLEDQLSGKNDSIVSQFMPRFCAADTTPEQVQDWYSTHGFA